MTTIPFRLTLFAPATWLRMQGSSALLTSDLFANFIVGVVFLNALGAMGESLSFGIFLVLALLSLIFI